MTLQDLGWNDYFESLFSAFRDKNYIPARICREDKNIYRIACANGRFYASVSGKFMHTAQGKSDFPAVGDWVAIAPVSGDDRAVIHAILPRRSSFTRKAVLSGGNPGEGGKTDEQVLAANIDTIFLITGLDLDFNLRRLERYLSIAWDSGANPVILLNKADLREDIETVLKDVAGIAFGVPVHAVSAKDNSGIDQLHQYLAPGRTVAFLGSSGVGKSSLINRLLGEDLIKTTEVRAYDNRGRHTTTHRELFIIPSGAIVIDTPGMRVLKAFSDDEGLSRTFEDIESLTGQCRFADCTHQNEPGCAIQMALSDGSLDSGRYESYLKLQKEIAHLERRKDVKRLRQSSREWDKKIKQHHAAMKELRKRGLA